MVCLATSSKVSFWLNTGGSILSSVYTELSYSMAVD